MNDIPPMDKTFLILIGIIAARDIACRFIDYLRYRESLKEDEGEII